MSRRHSKREATAALHFWQALEYLAPQKAPKVDRKELVWKWQLRAEGQVRKTDTA